MLRVVQCVERPDPYAKGAAPAKRASAAALSAAAGQRLAAAFAGADASTNTTTTTGEPAEPMQLVELLCTREVRYLLVCR